MSTITTNEKKEIQWALQVYVNSYSSQKKAAESLNDCSEATVIQILKGDWESISDAKWRAVQKQVVETTDFSKMVETQNFQTLLLYYTIAKEEGVTFAFVGGAGWGKSYTGKWYAAAKRNANVYYLEIDENWNKKVFLNNLLQQMGKNGSGMNVYEMMQTLITTLLRQHQPLIILDEIDKLPDPVLKFFITLYNRLNRHCGFVWQSTNAIEKRITKGMNKNAIGFHELFSRIGGNFIELREPMADEVREICIANGITEGNEISSVINEVRNLKGDLRRVDRNILKEKIKKTRRQLKAA